ncbi:Repetitive proline-rich cell wall protein [Paramyrothecium foliicola]|nr:Repetitive proline-rich cell wall protein [Paramyrothecium foliicola]
MLHLEAALTTLFSDLHWSTTLVELCSALLSLNFVFIAMFIKSSLVVAGALTLGNVLVHGAVLPVQMRDVAASNGAPEVQPIVLAPYNPRKKAPVSKIASLSEVSLKATPLKLQESEILYWYSDGYYASATLTAVNDKQKIVSVEDWEDMIESLDCPSASDITMTLNDKTSVQEILGDLAWVTEAKENKFIFVTDEECGGDDGRQPYMIHDYEVSEAAGQVTLKGKPVEWEALGVEIDLHLATEPFGIFLEAEDELTRRSSGFLDLAKDVSGVTLGSHVTNEITLALTCAECKVTGGINWDLSFNKNPFSDNFGPQGQLSTANGFGGRFALGVRASGALLDGFDLASIELLAIPLTPISLGKIAKLTPQVTVNAKASVSAIQAEVEAKFGVGMSIPDGTTLRIRGDSDDINPDFEMIGPELKGKVSVSALLTPVVTLDITAEVLSKGVTVGFGLEAPAFDAKLAVEANTEGVCGNPNGLIGLSGTVGVGAALNFFYGIGKPKDQPNKIQLLRVRHELWGECLVLEEKPVVLPPIEEPPVILPPVEEPPVIAPPVEDPPVTPPVEEPPVSTPPTEEPPAETPPSEGNPPMSTPVEETPIETPSTSATRGLPVEETPPVVENPVTETPPLETPIVSSPVSGPPTTSSSAVDYPAPTPVVPEVPGNSTEPVAPTPSGPSCATRRRHDRRNA